MISGNNNKLVSIIILSYNQVDFTKNCLESIKLYTNYPYEIIVIDNNSDNNTIEFLEKQNDITLVKNSENKGFSAGCNQGMSIAKGYYIMLINNDTIVTPNYLHNMIRVLETEPYAAIVGPYTNNTIGRQKLNVDLDYENKAEIIEYGIQISNNNYKPILTPRLIGFCMLFHKEFIAELNMFDEAFKIGNYEDDDLCIRTLLNNKRLYICNNSFVYHFKRATFDKNKMNFEEISLNNKLVLEDKWYNLNWNHYAETNSYIENSILDIKPQKVLHIGCGVGALGISIKQNIDCEYIGTETHTFRYKISSKFLDKVYYMKDLIIIGEIKKQYYDVVVIEDFIEQFGLNYLKLLEPFINSDTIVFLRVFNKYHISTIEALVKGSIWGNTIGAASPNFKYYYGDIEKDLCSKFKYSVINKIEILKKLKLEEQKLYEKLKDYDDFTKESLIYNRIYELRMHK